MKVVTGRGARHQLVTRRTADWADARSGRLRDLDLSLRVEQKDDGSGGFEGWGCVFGVRDTYGTTFDAGCFTTGGLDPSPYPYLAMHSPMAPIGTFTAEERAEGLWVAGEYDPTPEGQGWRQRALSGSAPELSVGFVWLDDGGDDDPDLITSARLVETSQIVLRMGSVPGAALQGVRADDDPDRKSRVARAHALLNLRMAGL